MTHDRSKDKTESLVRFAFWLGAITDGLAVIPMMFPDIGTMLFGGGSAKFGPEYRYAMGVAASLMAGWTLLLLWGSAKPLERRGILLLTLFPVIAGIGAATVYGVINQVVVLRRIVPLWMHLGIVSVLYVVSFLLAGKAKR